MSSRGAKDGVRILGARKFSAENLLVARAGRARKSPQTRTPPLAAFRSRVWKYWKKNGRHNLPWRKTRDPYKILVSEIMLQQTQVDRVIPYYGRFLREFPTVSSLAKAPLADVLKLWSGLGYNRRAKYLREAAVHIAEHGGKMPRDYESLRALAGVGDYTARAVRAFAYNEAEILVETNIRTALIHHFFPHDARVADEQLMTLLSKVIDAGRAREWSWALMDYGSHLKRSGVRVNHRSAHYTKQSKFEGSLRQVRGAMLRHLTSGARINDLRSRYSDRIEEALASLVRDGLITQQKERWRLV